LKYPNQYSNELQLLAQVEETMQALLPDTESTVRDAGYHHLTAGGSRVRAKLAIQAACALGLDEPASVAISSATEILHNASLLHDDLQDSDPIRRGQEAVWKKFGKNAAICTGDLFLSAAYAALARCRTERLTELICHMHQNTEKVISGQQADLEADTYTKKAYEKIARMKSGPLLGLPVELCLIAAGYSTFVPLAQQASYEIAIAYQVTDDIQDMDKDKVKGALNYTSLLTGSPTEVIDEARAYASERAKKAQRAAADLPNGSGFGLNLLAQRFIYANEH
jgi:geranylgeranyl diphosphate synthase type II